MLNFIFFIFFVVFVLGLVWFFIMNREKFSGSFGNVANKNHGQTLSMDTQAQPITKHESDSVSYSDFHIKKRPESYSYRLKNFLSPAERSFCGVLSRVVDGQNFIFAKVRVADILSPAMFKNSNRSEWQKAFNSISSKHFDFIVCDLKTIKVQYVIELDDSSHKTQKAKDQFKDAICHSAGLPLVRIRASKFYSTESIKDQIEHVIKPSGFEVSEFSNIN